MLPQGNLSEFVKVRPEARSYYELSAAKIKFNLPKPGFLDGVKSRARRASGSEFLPCAAVSLRPIKLCTRRTLLCAGQLWLSNHQYIHCATVLHALHVVP